MKYVLLGIGVVFVGAIVLVFALHEGEPELDVFADIKYLYEHERYEDIKTEYGKMIKDAIVEFSKHEGWWHHEQIANSELEYYATNPRSMYIGNWNIRIPDLTIDSHVSPNLQPGESGCAWSIEGRIELVGGKFVVKKTHEMQAMNVEPIEKSE